MEVIQEDKQPEGTQDTHGAAVTLSRDEVNVEDVRRDVEDIHVQCKTN